MTRVLTLVSRPNLARRIGSISTRLAGTDGVSLESAKWGAVLERLGGTCFHFAGQLDRALERSRLVPEAFYRHPEIDAINGVAFAGTSEVTAAADAEHPAVHRRDFFSPYVRPPAITRRIDELRGRRPDGAGPWPRTLDHACTTPLTSLSRSGSVRICSGLSSSAGVVASRDDIGVTRARSLSGRWRRPPPPTVE